MDVEGKPLASLRFPVSPFDFTAAGLRVLSHLLVLCN